MYVETSIYPPAPRKETVFFSSPFKGLDCAQKLAQYMVEKIMKTSGNLVIAPHLYLPMFFKDDVMVEREKSIELCKHLIVNVCDSMILYTGCGITSGMEEEINSALEDNLRILPLSNTRFIKTYLTETQIDGFYNLIGNVKRSLPLGSTD